MGRLTKDQTPHFPQMLKPPIALSNCRTIFCLVPRERIIDHVAYVGCQIELGITPLSDNMLADSKTIAASTGVRCGSPHCAISMRLPGYGQDNIVSHHLVKVEMQTG